MFLGNVDSKPENVHVFPLERGIKLVSYPPPEKVKRYSRITDCQPSDSAVTMFVGQVPNMMPLMYLAWVIDSIAGEYVLESLKHARKSGCAVAYVRPAALHVILNRSRTVLLDVNGFWRPDPKVPEELRDLHEYVNQLRSGEHPAVHRDGRVPKGCIVFEEMGKPKLTTQANPELGHLQAREAGFRSKIAGPMAAPTMLVQAGSIAPIHV